mgnify:CR=1 FL=1
MATAHDAHFQLAFRIAVLSNSLYDMTMSRAQGFAVEIQWDKLKKKGGPSAKGRNHVRQRHRGLARRRRPRLGDRKGDKYRYTPRGCLCLLRDHGLAIRTGPHPLPNRASPAHRAPVRQDPADE